MVKNMKKVICGILCMMMVFSMFTVSAATLTIDEENIVVSDADATTGLRTVTIPYTVDVDDDEEAPAYLTMLASKTETVDATNIGTSAIGIEQIANDAAVTSISFVTDKIEAGATYYVKMGATNLATPATATFSLAAAGGDEGGDDPAPATYTVTFYAEADAATAYATKTTDADGKVEAPTAPTKDGFTFAGWATTAGATAADVDLATKVFTANTTLYAVWTAVVTPSVVYGELDGVDGISLADAIYTLQIATGSLSPTDAQKLAADVDGVEGVSLADAIYVLQKATGSIDKFPVEG